MSESAGRVAIVGASSDRRKFGNKAVRAYAHAGWEVLPVNPKEPAVEGLTAYPSLADVPGALDRISIYLPPPVTLKLVPELAAKAAGDVWLNPGSADAAVLEACRKAGVNAVPGCSIVAIGLSPSQFP